MATLGETSNAGTVTDTIGANSKAACAFTATEDGEITKISMWVSGQGSGVGAQPVKAVVYSDSGSNTPFQLLGTSIEASVPEGAAFAWRDWTFASPVQFLAGQKIWIGFHGSTPADGSQIKAFSGSGIRFVGDTYSDGPSDPFGASTLWTGASRYCIYATYTPISAPPPTPSSPWFKGIATGYILNKSLSIIQRQMAEIADAGAQIVRFDLNAIIWSATQAAINAAIAEGLTCYMTYNNAHDTTSIHNNLDLMAPWLRDRGQHHWEFINEPNGKWGGWDTNNTAATGAQYTAALKVFTPYLKAIDPSAYVIAGALSPAPDDYPNSVHPTTFFNDMLTAGLATGDLDALSVHCYDIVDNTLSWNMYRLAWGAAPSFRSQMDAKGWTTKPIWLSESGEWIGWTVASLQQRILDIYAFRRTTTHGPFGAFFIYSAEQTDGVSVLWPGGVPNGAANTFASIQVPSGGSTTLATADMSVTFNIRATRKADLTPFYNVAPQSPAIHTVNANLSPTFNIVSRISRALTVNFSIDAHGFTEPGSTVVEPEPLPTDLESFADRIYDEFAPLAGRR